MSDLKKYGAWSITKLSTANSCSLRFKFEYIDKKKKHEVISPAGRIGAAAHKVLELMLKGGTYARAFSVGATDAKLTYNEMESLACLKESILDFLSRIDKWKQSHPVNQELVEFKFGFNEQLKPTDFWSKDAVFRGAIDLGLKLNNKSLVVLDHKSGTPKAVENYRDQLQSYAAAGLILYPDIISVDTRVHFLTSKEVVNGPLMTAEKIRDEIIPWLMTWMKDTVNLIESSEAKPTKGWYCNFCSYKNICPAWQIGTEIETELPLDLEIGNKNNI